MREGKWLIISFIYVIICPIIILFTNEKIYLKIGLFIVFLLNLYDIINVVRSKQKNENENINEK